MRPPPPVEGQVHVGRWGKLAWVPDSTLISLLLVIAGVGYLVNPDAVTHRPPHIAVQTVGFIYVVAGVCRLLGLWQGGQLGRPLWAGIELLGHGLLVIGVVTWFLIAIGYGSPSALQQGLTSLVVVWAAGVRAWQILHHRVLIQIDVEPIAEAHR